MSEDWRDTAFGRGTYELRLQLTEQKGIPLSSEWARVKLTRGPNDSSSRVTVESDEVRAVGDNTPSRRHSRIPWRQPWPKQANDYTIDLFGPVVHREFLSPGVPWWPLVPQPGESENEAPVVLTWRSSIFIPGTSLWWHLAWSADRGSEMALYGATIETPKGHFGAAWFAIPLLKGAQTRGRKAFLDAPPLGYPEYADKAIKLMENGYSLEQAAANLGKKPGTLKRWVRERRAERREKGGN